MSKRSLKILIVVFSVLAVVTIIVTLTGNKKQAGNFKSVLSDVESSDVDRIEIRTPGKEAFILVKSGADSWELQYGGEKYTAQNSSVITLLSEATRIKVKQVVSRSKDSWENYRVTDSLGTYLSLYSNDELVSGIVAGRISFSQSRSPYQQQPDVYSYLRPVGEDLVYSAKSMLSMTLDRGPEIFRDPSIVKTSPENLRTIRFSYPADSSYMLMKADSIWLTQDTPVDSASMAGYQNTLRNFSDRNFASKSDLIESPAIFEIVFEGDNMDAVSVKAWEASTSEDYIVTSTQNEGAVFKLNQNQFERIFKGRGHFLK